MKGATLLVLQGGGPTAVVNATLAGVIERARASGFRKILGARRGFAGLLVGETVDLTHLPPSDLDHLARTPGAALGTSRDRLDDQTVHRALAVLDRHEVDAVIAIGGNDTAATAQVLLARAQDTGRRLRLIHVPKTIDNDLPENDHTPGYPSAARFLALAARSLAIDCWSVRELYAFTFLEVQGRNAGWLAAATALAMPKSWHPHLVIVLPECPPPSRDTLVEELIAACETRGWLLVVLPETLRDRRGNPLGGPAARWVDPHGHPYPPSPAEALAELVTTASGKRTRIVRPNALARSFLLATSERDREEARAIGHAAVDRLAAGPDAVSIALERLADEPYRIAFRPVPLESVAGRERPVPPDFIAADGRGVTDAFFRYARPLVEPLDAEESVLVL
ncbi:MAG: diphosphate--fructose-6-phosphate 1-phosphotransferase [Thermomicrobium sp.]|nr:diphosphate--fructose-6-phosphate 1-phosphotransferase [Thermomicrobium sp.]